MEPDVLGLPLREALPLLERYGYRRLKVRETRPPWSKAPTGQARVVHQKVLAGGEILLVVSFENYS